MKSIETHCVAVLVATAHRADLLASRALPSIESQTRTPWRVVVVDDSRTEAAARRTERVARGWRPAGIGVDFLGNRRAQGASGAWNSGLDHLLRICDDPRQVYVAILDDDDRWEPGHLDHCLALAERRRLDLVAAPFLRIEEDTETELVIPPRSLRAGSFLAGNPGIQGSNLFCRLSTLLEVGLFDESLPSCTDRDLCIRISDLPDVRYGATACPTVHHYACRSRLRLSTPGSPPGGPDLTASSASTGAACRTPSASGSGREPGSGSDGRNRRPSPSRRAPPVVPLPPRHRERPRPPGVGRT